MMKHKYLLLFFTLVSFGTEAQNPAVPILRNEYKTEVSHKSISYDVVYKSKCGFRDTAVIRGSVKLLKAKDTFFDGYIWWSMGDTEFQLYDLVNGYDVKMNSKTVIKSTYHIANPMVYSASAIDTRILWLNFFRPKEIDTTLWLFFNDTFELENDTLIADIPCWHIFEKLQDRDSFSRNFVYDIYISKIDYTQLLTICKGFSFGLPSYSFYRMTNVIYDKVKKVDFSTSIIPKDFTMKNYVYNPSEPDSTDKVMQNYIELYNFKKKRDYERQKGY